MYETSSGAPTAGARNIFFGGHFTQQNNRVVNPPSKFRWLRNGGNRNVWSHGSVGVVDRVYNLRKGEYFVAGTNIYVTDIEAYVQKAYKGADASATLTVQNQGPGVTGAFMSLNAKGTGYRRTTQLSATTAATGDTVNVLTDGMYVEGLVMHLRGTGGTGVFTDADAEDLPVITVRVQGTQPGFSETAM